MTTQGFKCIICPGCVIIITIIFCSGQRIDQCEDSGVLQKFVGSYQILLYTLFAALASTAFLFLGKESLYSARGL